MFFKIIYFSKKEDKWVQKFVAPCEVKNYPNPAIIGHSYDEKLTNKRGK